MKILFNIVVVIFFVCVSPCAADPYSGSDVVGIESIVDDIATPNDETWRLEANQRIDQVRKADMDITVIDEENGLPVPGVEIDVKLTRHQFRFGGIARARTLTGNDFTPTVSEQFYKDTYLNMGFNAAGFNNAFKQKLTNLEQFLPEALGWFQEHQIPVRGHCLIWPGTNSTGVNHLTAAVDAALILYNSDPTEINRQNLIDTIETQMIYWASQWDVFEWDVINEERGNHDIMDALGDSVMIDWFNIAQQYSVNPNVKLLLNEFQIISDVTAGIETNNINEYRDTVRYLLSNGAPLTGFGFQSRFGTMLSPDTIYQRLQLFEEFDLPISATEFEMKVDIGTELNKAEMTERVMTVYFSHYLVNGIYAWSFFPNEEREIVDINGLPNLRGKIWLYLMKNHWMTDETLDIDQTGHASVRGFKGDYDITVHYPGGEKVVQVSLDQDSSFTIEVELGDSDGDGVSDSVEGDGDLDLDGIPDYLDPGTFPLSFAQEDFFSSLFTVSGGDKLDAFFNSLVDFDDFDDSVATTTQTVFDIGGGGGGDGFSLVYGPENELILAICSDVSTQIKAFYTLSPERVAAGTVEITGIVDIDHAAGDGTEDIIKLFVDRELVASAVTNLVGNDFINTDKSGFGMTGGAATGGWPSDEDSVDFTSGTIDYARGLWYSDDITGIDLGWCIDANIDGVYPIDINDFNLMASNWQLTGTGLQGDINKDGHVDIRDLNMMASNWLSDCSQ